MQSAVHRCPEGLAASGCPERDRELVWALVRTVLQVPPVASVSFVPRQVERGRIGRHCLQGMQQHPAEVLCLMPVCSGN